MQHASRKPQNVKPSTKHDEMLRLKVNHATEMYTEILLQQQLLRLCKLGGVF